MNAATLHAVIVLILGILAVATFMIQGKQWPTFIFATLFGMFFGSTEWGQAISDNVAAVVTGIIRSLQ